MPRSAHTPAATSLAPATLRRMATILDEVAQGLADAHMLHGAWPDSPLDQHAKRSHDEMRRLAVKARRAAPHRG